MKTFLCFLALPFALVIAVLMALWHRVFLFFDPKPKCTVHNYYFDCHGNCVLDRWYNRHPEQDERRLV